MNRLRRRHFLVGLGATGLAGTGLVWVGQRQNPRERVLEQTIRRVAIPDARLIFDATHVLKANVEQLQRVASVEQLALTQRSWRNAVLAWERAIAFQQGPFVDSSALLRAAFWPVRRDAIDERLADTDSADSALLAGLGVDVKGLFALEQLLFDERSDAGKPWLLNQRTKQPRCWATAISSRASLHAVGSKI
jgi:predicted lipoprotein